jgi:hypothetical protein
MKYGSAEDRLNPIAPDDADETTLGGYVAVHGRAAAFEGKDGEPYTVGIETDPGEGTVAGYLVFIRWARTGTAIMGHLGTDDLVHERDEASARAALEALPLREVRALLDATIERAREDGPSGAPPPPGFDRPF